MYFTKKADGLLGFSSSGLVTLRAREKPVDRTENPPRSSRYSHCKQSNNSWCSKTPVGALPVGVFPERHIKGV